MRHIPESLLNPLLRILNEYEAGVKAKHKRTLTDHARLYDISRIKIALTKKHIANENRLCKHPRMDV